jgi:GH25 family lysozyme M1 (1,4-beta-N-acetylmuramidase)
MTRLADFSEWQLDINWDLVAQEVANGTLDGVILRVQAGSTHADAKYAEYVAGCKAHNIPFGTYAYFKAVSDADAVQEATDAYARMDKDSKFFAIDIEAVTCPNLVTSGQAFYNYLKQQGVEKVGLYSGEYFYQQHGLSGINVDFVWIAKYGANDGQPHTAPTVGYDLWQYTSTGHINGVTTNVDLSQLNPSGKGLDYFVGTKPAPVAPEVVAPPQPPAPYGSTGRYVYLPPVDQKGQHNDTWRVYPLNAVCKAGNECGLLAPYRFGGLSYKILRDRGDIGEHWVFEVQTDSFGRVKLYADPSTSAKVLDSPMQPQPQPVYHTVVSGDTVSGLAVKFGTTVSQIDAWNNLKDVNSIFVGQKLRVR